MSNSHGNDGVVEVGSNAIGEVQTFTYTEEDVAPAERTSMGDTVGTPVASGCKRGKGDVTCLLDEADTGQGAITVGASVVLHLYPDTDAGTELTGTVVVRTLDRMSVDKTDLNKWAFTYEGVLTAA